MTAPVFEFEMRYTHRDEDPYYHTNWEKGGKTTVLAANREEAFTNLWAMLGKAPSHRYWIGKVLSSKQISRGEA